MMKDGLTQYLINSALFNDEELDFSVDIFAQKKIEAGDFFIEENKNCNTIGFIEKGGMKAFSTDSQGNQNITCFKFENQFATSYSDFNLRQKSKLSIQAIEDSVISYIDYSAFNLLIDKIPAWNLIIQSVLSQEFLNKENYMVSYNHKTAFEKYQLLMKDSPKLIQRATGKDIASFLGIDPRTLTRIRREMAIKK